MQWAGDPDQDSAQELNIQLAYSAPVSQRVTLKNIHNTTVLGLNIDVAMVLCYYRDDTVGRGLEQQ